MNQEVLQNILSNLHMDDVIGYGYDSVVYHFLYPDDQTNYVAKYYPHQHLSPNQAKYYQTVMNRAAEEMRKEKWLLKFTSISIPYRIFCVPFLQLLEIGDYSIGIAEQISSQNGEKYEKNRRFVSELEKTAENIGQRLGVKGLYFSPVNTRVDSHKRVIHITDLCNCIIQMCGDNSIW